MRGVTLWRRIVIRPPARKNGGYLGEFRNNARIYGIAGLAAAAAAAAMVCSDLLCDENETNRKRRRRRSIEWSSSLRTMAFPKFRRRISECEPFFRKESTSFQVMAALESKDEVKRIRLAQILHDLHELAQQQMASRTPTATLQRKGTLRQLWRIARRPFSTPTPKEVPPMSRHDFGNMTPARAQILIDELVNNGGKFEPACLLSLLHTASNVLKLDETLLDLRGVADTVCVVGDLHGSLSSLNFVLQALKSEIGSNTVVVFDGDFVDRGHQSVEVICVLLLLKLAYPRHVYLLRGNHEDVLVASAYGFQNEVQEKYGVDHIDALWDAFNEVFCALPIAAVTETAAIVHGGLPSMDFTLDDIKKVSVEERCQIKSTIEPSTEIGRLLQGLLWSDPSTWNGIHHNTTRTIGVFYGPDVVANFLTHHNLKYLVRGHEVAEHGANVMACGRDGQSVITVFSHSEYPNGEGSNLGAYVNLHKSGEHDLVTFSRASKFLLSADNKLNPKDPYVETLKSLIASNKHNLERTFSSVAPDGSIQASKWANVMADSLELPDVPWLALIPSIAPQSNDDLEHIDWRAFLQLYVPSAGDRNCADTNINMEILHANHQMLITVYNFLDFDGDGRVDLEEFKTGVELLNKRLPEDRQIRDPVAMFRRIDRDGHGAFDMEEFEEVFRV